MIKTQEFTAIVGETYTTVRNIYGRPGRAPRHPGPHEADFRHGRHRRFVFADALAWRFTRSLSGAALDWDVVAGIVLRETVADRVLAAGEASKGWFFAIWPVVSEGRTEWAAGSGTLSEIAEMIDHDATSAEVGVVLAVSCAKVLAEATDLAHAAGYAVVAGELVAQQDAPGAGL